MPLAGGNPIPSGRTSMFSAAICAAVAGWPKPLLPTAPGVTCAPARGAKPRARAPASSAATRTSTAPEVVCQRADTSPILRLDIGHLPVRRHVPADDAVEQLKEVGSARCDQLGAGGLDVAGLVG